MLSLPLAMIIKPITMLSILFMASVSSVYLVGDRVFGANDSFSADGRISSLVLGMPHPHIQSI